MSKPEIKENLDGYTFNWEEEKIQIQVSHIKQHTDGRCDGELDISCNMPNILPHLHKGRFNLLSDVSRDKLARSLSDRIKLDWYSILEQLKVYTLDKVRRGEPFEEVWSGDDAEPPAFVLNPYLIENLPTLFYGEPGSAKSTIALIIASVLQLGWYDNPLGLIPMKDYINVMWLDYETDKNTIRWQQSCIARGMEIGAFPIFYRRCFAPLANDIDAIRKGIDEFKTKLLVVDSCGPACGGELKEAGPVLTFFGALRSLKITSLLLGHNSKNTETREKTPYGSIYWQANSRSIWEIRKVQEAGENQIDVGLFHRKPPPFQGLHKPIGMKLTFEGDKTIIAPEDPKTVGEFIERMGVQQRILEELRNGPQSVKQLADSLSIGEANIRMGLKRLKDKQSVTKVGDRWGLLAVD